MYKEFYGLSRKPFQLSPDPSFFFAGSKHKKAMSYLQYGLEQGEGFIVITGPIGTGKSTLARNMLAQLSTENIITNQIVTTNLEPDELLQLVANGFGIRYQQQTKAQLLQQLDQYLVQLHKEQKRALLIIDEAQNLPAATIEELRMLSNFQLDDKPLLQSFLLGQEELQDTLKQPNMEQFRQRIIASCHIDALNEQETAGYVLHRLTQAGWQGNPALPEDALDEIYNFSQGIPRKINILCDRLLLAGFLSELNILSAQLVIETGKELGDELINNNRPAIPTSEKIPLQSTENDSSNQAIQFREHLEQVFEFLDKTLSTKLKLLKHLEHKIEKKHEHYQQVSAELESMLQQKDKNDN